MLECHAWLQDEYGPHDHVLELTYELRTRSRLRAGFHWDTGRARGFYGLTWLGPEFTGQRTGQLVGSVRLNIDF